MQKTSSVAVIGRFGKTYGLRGWIKVHSDTLPAENILDYQPWLIQQEGTWQPVEVDDVKIMGNQMIAHIKNIDDISRVKSYVAKEIGVERSTFPKLDDQHYYWSDLIGMTVINEKGDILGQVDHLIETGANDVLVVTGKKRCLIPYVSKRVVTEVDMNKKTITVNWDTEF